MALFEDASEFAVKSRNKAFIILEARQGQLHALFLNQMLCTHLKRVAQCPGLSDIKFENFFTV